MVLLDRALYVANTDSVMRYDDEAGATSLTTPGHKVLDLPAGGYNNHWTRNIVANRDGTRLYVTVGSQTNVDEEGWDAKDPRRAAILECNPLGAHTASLGLVFYRGSTFPEAYRGGAFVGQRGSWNRSAFAGYRVLFVPFKGGRPAGRAQDFLTGFIANEQTSEVYGRPVGVTVGPDGSLLVADDAGGTVWRVSAKHR
jgi:glucose/arabinose dehydrogenase